VSLPKPVDCGCGGGRSRWVAVAEMGRSYGCVVGRGGRRRLVVVTASQSCWSWIEHRRRDGGRVWVELSFPFLSDMGGSL
jgi:hypothetical protein